VKKRAVKRAKGCRKQRSTTQQAAPSKSPPRAGRHTFLHKPRSPKPISAVVTSSLEKEGPRKNRRWWGHLWRRAEEEGAPATKQKQMRPCENIKTLPKKKLPRLGGEKTPILRLQKGGKRGLGSTSPEERNAGNPVGSKNEKEGRSKVYSGIHRRPGLGPTKGGGNRGVPNERERGLGGNRKECQGSRGQNGVFCT